MIATINSKCLEYRRIIISLYTAIDDSIKNRKSCNNIIESNKFAAFITTLQIEVERSKKCICAWLRLIERQYQRIILKLEENLVQQVVTPEYHIKKLIDSQLIGYKDIIKHCQKQRNEFM
jgi:hypothetical protein